MEEPEHDKCRDEFEIMTKRKWPHRELKRDGHSYIDQYIRYAWFAWQSAWFWSSDSQPFEEG